MFVALRISMIAIFISATGASAGEWLPNGNPGRLGFDQDRLGRITPLMQGHVDAGRMSGAVMAIAREGRVVYRDTVGFSDIASKDPMTLDSVFRLYSMTKPITSTAVMILIEEGKIRLTDPVSKFIPAFAQMKVYVSGGADDMVFEEQTQPITIRHLLSHTSGIPYGSTRLGPVQAEYVGLDSFGIRTLQNFAETIAAKPLVFQPGSRWMYGLSVDVLGYVVEVASGMPFQDFLAQRIMEPLGMDQTSFYLSSDQLERFTTLYEATETGLTPSENLGTDTFGNSGRVPSGGAGIISTISDYLRFSQMLLNGGELDRVRILSPRSIDLMRRNHLTDEQRFAPGLGFGLGFSVVDDPGVSGTILSEGSYLWAGAADTHFWIDPEKQIIGLVMTQRRGQGNFIRDDMRTMTYQALMN